MKKISRVAYELKLPEDWSIHPVFHISLLKQWREGTWSRAVDAPLPEVDQTQQQGYEVERILKYRSVRRGSRRSREYLVIWTGYPLDEAEWIPEANFHDPAELRKQLKKDKPTEDLGDAAT